MGNDTDLKQTLSEHNKVEMDDTGVELGCVSLLLSGGGRGPEALGPSISLPGSCGWSMKNGQGGDE